MPSNSRSLFFGVLALLLLATVTLCQTKPADQERTVEYKRVSFRYDPTVFGEVKSETVDAQPLEEAGDKPDGVAPEHLHFEFAFGREDNDAQVSVYPLNGFSRVYSANENLAKSIDQKIKGLREVLKDTTYRLDGQIPHLPFRDATDNFYTRVKHFNFQNGRGILFVTHWTHGVALVSNRNLVYRFEGITDDGKYYVTAETPVSVRFLPFDPPDRFEGFTYENLFEAYRRPEMKRRYEDYIKSITDRLRKLEPIDFHPNLERFESMIASLKVAR